MINLPTDEQLEEARVAAKRLGVVQDLLGTLFVLAPEEGNSTLDYFLEVADTLQDELHTIAMNISFDNIKEELLEGKKVGDKTFKIHLDGYNMLPYLTGEEKEGRRREIFYFSDDGDLTALRYDDWKLIFMEQRMEGTLGLWANPFTPLRMPLVFNLKRDPYEVANITSNTYYDWLIDHAYLLVPAQDIVGEFLMTFQEYPPRAKAASFSLDQVMDKLSTPTGN